MKKPDHLINSIKVIIVCAILGVAMLWIGTRDWGYVDETAFDDPGEGWVHDCPDCIQKSTFDSLYEKNYARPDGTLVE